MPRGFSIDQTLHIGTGNNAATVAPKTTAIPTSQATGRQRSEGGRPSGNNSATYTSRAFNGTHSQVTIQAEIVPPGRELGWDCRAKIAYSPQKWFSPAASPAPQINQPMGCWGRRERMRSPSAGKVTATTVSWTQGP
jgi:hypothetical protein